MFLSHPGLSDLTPTQYGAALDWLRREEVLAVGGSEASRASDRLAALTVLRAAVEGSSPAWLRDADRTIRSPDELPLDAASAAEVLELDPADAFHVIRSVWGRVDTQERTELGAAGEVQLLGLLGASLDAEMLHVSEISDGFGYDISVGRADESLHIEVKTTKRRGRLSVYLSRNEFEVMRADPCWRLVAVLLGETGQLAAVGTVDRNWIAQSVPTDSSAYGRWESVRLDVPRSAVSPGIADVQHWVRPGVTAYLLQVGFSCSGEPQWLNPPQAGG